MKIMILSHRRCIGGILLATIYKKEGINSIVSKKSCTFAAKIA